MLTSFLLIACKIPWHIVYAWAVHAVASPITDSKLMVIMTFLQAWTDAVSSITQCSPEHTLLLSQQRVNSDAYNESQMPALLIVALATHFSGKR